LDFILDNDIFCKKQIVKIDRFLFDFVSVLCATIVSLLRLVLVLLNVLDKFRCSVTKKYFLIVFELKPLSKEDRMDLFKHEYAHYMQYNYAIPKQYEWQPGIHGSAWKYCCSLIGAPPTPFYKAGEALMKHNYEKVLKNPIHDKTVPLKDTYRRERKYQAEKNSVVQYKVGDTIKHPKFGPGVIEYIEQMSGSVRLHIRFGEETKVIDQKWLLKTTYQ
jgi:hypothetical protein